MTQKFGPKVLASLLVLALLATQSNLTLKITQAETTPNSEFANKADYLVEYFGASVPTDSTTTTTVTTTYSTTTTDSTATEGTEQGYVAQEVLVQFNPTALTTYTEAEIKEKLADAGLTKKDTKLEDSGVSELAASGRYTTYTTDQTTAEALGDLADDPELSAIITAAQPNFVYEIQGRPMSEQGAVSTATISATTQATTTTTCPNGINDTLCTYLWGLFGDYGIKFSNYLNNRSSLSGSEEQVKIITAVIDDGLDHAHADLKNQVWKGDSCVDINGESLGRCQAGYDFVADDTDPTPDDPVGENHGTHVAGTIGAEMNNNNEGIVGVAANNVELMGLKAGDADYLYTASILNSILFARENGAQVVNMSFGAFGTTCESVFSESEYLAMRDSPEILFVAAAGNSGDDHNDDAIFNTPADYGVDTECWEALPNVISVAAIGSNGNLTSFSDYGRETVHVAAPGQEIWSTVPQNYELVTIHKYSAELANFSNFTDVSTSSTAKWSIYTNNGYDYLQTPTDYASDDTTSHDETTAFTTSPTIDASDYSNALDLTLVAQCDTEYSETEWLDYVSVLASSDGTNFTEIGRFDEYILKAVASEELNDTGSSSLTQLDFTLASDFTSNATIQIRLDWITNGNRDNGSAGEGCLIESLVLTTTSNAVVDLYAEFQGTSMAAPHVAGIATNLKSFDTSRTASEIKDIILNSVATDIDLDLITGGRVDLDQALINLNTLAAPGNLTISATIPTDQNLTSNFTNAEVLSLTLSADTAAVRLDGLQISTEQNLTNLANLTVVQKTDTTDIVLGSIAGFTGDSAMVWFETPLTIDTTSSVNLAIVLNHSDDDQTNQPFDQADTFSLKLNPESFITNAAVDDITIQSATITTTADNLNDPVETSNLAFDNATLSTDSNSQQILTITFTDGPVDNSGDDSNLKDAIKIGRPDIYDYEYSALCESDSVSISDNTLTLTLAADSTPLEVQDQIWIKAGALADSNEVVADDFFITIEPEIIAPSGLAVETNLSTLGSLSFTWNDNSNNETDFLLSLTGDWNLEIALPADYTSFTLPCVLPGETYAITLQARVRHFYDEDWYYSTAATLENISSTNSTADTLETIAVSEITANSVWLDWFVYEFGNNLNLCENYFAAANGITQYRVYLKTQGADDTKYKEVAKSYLAPYDLTNLTTTTTTSLRSTTQETDPTTLTEAELNAMYTDPLNNNILIDHLDPNTDYTIKVVALNDNEEIITEPTKNFTTLAEYTPEITSVTEDTLTATDLNLSEFYQVRAQQDDTTIPISKPQPYFAIDNFGSEEQQPKILSNKNYVYFSGNWLGNLGYANSSKSGIYRMKTDESDTTKVEIEKILPTWIFPNFAIENNKIYFTNANNTFGECHELYKGKIFQADLDGNNVTEFLNNESHYLKIEDFWLTTNYLYYSQVDYTDYCTGLASDTSVQSGLYRVPLTGTNSPTLILADNPTQIAFTSAGNELYYLDYYDNLYLLDLDQSVNYYLASDISDFALTQYDRVFVTTNSDYLAANYLLELTIGGCDFTQQVCETSFTSYLATNGYFTGLEYANQQLFFAEYQDVSWESEYTLPLTDNQAILYTLYLTDNTTTTLENSGYEEIILQSDADYLHILDYYSYSNYSNYNNYRNLDLNNSAATIQTFNTTPTSFIFHFVDELLNLFEPGSLQIFLQDVNSEDSARSSNLFNYSSWCSSTDCTKPASFQSDIFVTPNPQTGGTLATYTFEIPLHSDLTFYPSSDDVYLELKFPDSFNLSSDAITLTDSNAHFASEANIAIEAQTIQLLLADSLTAGDTLNFSLSNIGNPDTETDYYRVKVSFQNPTTEEEFFVAAPVSSAFLLTSNLQANSQFNDTDNTTDWTISWNNGHLTGYNSLYYSKDLTTTQGCADAIAAGKDATDCTPVNVATDQNESTAYSATRSGLTANQAYFYFLVGNDDIQTSPILKLEPQTKIDSNLTTATTVTGAVVCDNSIVNSEDNNVVQLPGSSTDTLTLQAETGSELKITIPGNAQITATDDDSTTWDLTLNPPELFSTNPDPKKLSLPSPPADFSATTEPTQVVAALSVGSPTHSLTFSADVTVTVPVTDYVDGNIFAIYHSHDGTTWESYDPPVACQVTNETCEFAVPNFSDLLVVDYDLAIGDTQQVSCEQSGAPSNSTYNITNVTITYSEEGWSEPANCGYTCNSGYSGTNCEQDQTSTGGSSGGSGGWSRSYSTSTDDNEEETTSASTATPEFSDVPTTAWYKPYVDSLAANNILQGYSDDTFRPGNMINRAEIAKITVLAADLTEITTTSAPFADVAASAWYSSFVNTLKFLGIASGYVNGNFGPADSVTRGQFSKMVVEAFDLAESEFDALAALNPQTCPDVPSADWQTPYLNRLMALEVMGGYPDGTCKPNNPINRAEATKLIYLANLLQAN